MTACEAPRKTCGSASGWRVGGRCPRCRAAHNRDTSARRGLGADQRVAVLGFLRAGRSVDEAAEAVGVKPQLLSHAARVDGELRAALDGMPEVVQVAARRGDWLAALTRTGGAQAAAAKSIGLSLSTVKVWRQDPAFDAVMVALLDWLTTATGKDPRLVKVRVADAQLDAAAAYIEEGATITRAAELVGTSQSTLCLRAQQHERLQAAVEMAKKRPRRGRGRKSGLTAEVAGRLRELWATGATNAEIAAELNVSKATLGKWRAALQLPRKR